jgi:hypothetical protein
LAAVEDLLALTDRRVEPLRAAGLLVRRMQLRYTTGREYAPLADVREAVRLSADHPDSPEHALAMAELANVELLHDEPAGPARAVEALRLARACGSPHALTYALTTAVMARAITGDGSGSDDAQEAQAFAVQAGDFGAYIHATVWLLNSLEGAPTQAGVDQLRRAREELTALRAPHTYVAWLCTLEANALLQLGEWRGCVERLRVALGSAPGPMADVLARLTATQLAVWQGRFAEAEAHLACAEELFVETSGFLAFDFDAVRAEVAVATGATDRAVTAARTGSPG